MAADTHLRRLDDDDVCELLNVCVCGGLGLDCSSFSCMFSFSSR